MPLPEDWQVAMVEMIRGAAEPDGRWFTGGPALSPREQIEVYVEQYRLRIFDAVAEEVPGLVYLLGDEVESVLRQFIADHPSSSFTLNDVAGPLVDWLIARGSPQPWIDMAGLDCAVQRGFTAASGTPLRAEQLAVVPPLRLQPHVTLLALEHNVHEIRSALLGGEEVPELGPCAASVVVFRRGLKMRHWEIGAAPFALLVKLAEGIPVGVGLQQLVEEDVVTPETLQAEVAGWFRDFSERNLIEVAT